MCAKARCVVLSHRDILWDAEAIQAMMGAVHRFRSMRAHIGVSLPVDTCAMLGELVMANRNIVLYWPAARRKVMDACF